MVNATLRPLYPLKRFLVPTVQEAASAAWVWKSSLTARIDNRTVQQVQSRYTDGAIPAYISKVTE
jgi:hypothetical protein